MCCDDNFAFTNISLHTMNIFNKNAHMNKKLCNTAQNLNLKADKLN